MPPPLTLSVGAAYGVVVMVFQWGWGISLLGSESTGVVEPWLPLFLFAILFGLSMDYHMLVFNRIKEAHYQGHSNEESVSIGIKITAGQITAAAAIMVGVFLTFALGRQVPTQQMGLGLGVAVLIDATLIRVILLPASMKLLGEANWYLPKWLDWLPRVGSEGEKESQVIGRSSLWGRATKLRQPTHKTGPPSLAMEALSCDHYSLRMDLYERIGPTDGPGGVPFTIAPGIIPPPVSWFTRDAHPLWHPDGARGAFRWQTAPSCAYGSSEE